jgi:predicted ester cyclase
MSPEQIARQYYRYFNERNLDAAGQLVDRAASFRYVPSKQRLIGRAGYRALAAMWLHAFEDGQLEITSVTPVGDDTVVVKLLGRGTHTGDLILGDALTLPATGVAGALPFRETLRIRDGSIVDVELDFDIEDLKRQLLRNPGH